MATTTKRTATAKATTAAKETAAEAKEAAVEAKETVETKVEQSTNMLRRVAYAYVGTIAKSIDAVESLVEQYKSDRDALLADYVASGEAFVKEYSEKVSTQTDSLKEQLKFKKAA